jgi:hypothetical protein
VTLAAVFTTHLLQGTWDTAYVRLRREKDERPRIAELARPQYLLLVPDTSLNDNPRHQVYKTVEAERKGISHKPRAARDKKSSPWSRYGTHKKSLPGCLPGHGHEQGKEYSTDGELCAVSHVYEERQGRDEAASYFHTAEGCYSHCAAQEGKLMCDA